MAAECNVGLIIGQLHRGGAENQLVKLALGLSRRGRFDPIVYCLSTIVEPHGPQLQAHGVPLRMVAGAARSRMGRASELGAALRTDGVSIAHAFLLGPTVHTAIATRRGRGPAFIASVRTGEWRRPLIKRMLERWALGRARSITVNSTPAAGFVGRYYRVPTDRIRFIPNGVEPIGATLLAKETAREELGLLAGAPVLLGLFRLSPEKDLETFCSAAETALEGPANGICLIAGDGPLRGWLERRVADAPHPERFRVLGARDDVPRLLAAADLLLMTSRSEGMPNGVLEAMAAGLPVVATRVGGIPDLVEDGRTGRMCEAGDDAQFGAACRELLTDPAARREMGSRARARAEREFSVVRMVERYEAIYDRCLSAVAAR